MVAMGFPSADFEAGMVILVFPSTISKYEM
jgi:hypothetical protein